MKNLSVKWLLVFGSIALVTVFLWPAQQGESCYKTSDEEVQEFIKKDYFMRMLRWENDATLLGTRTPHITWSKIERMPTENEEVLLVPFKAEGPGGTKDYFGMYQCQQGFVEYATK